MVQQFLICIHPSLQIILPVVERSVTIAGISTRELVAKDFAAEPNEEKLRKAGHFMAQKLAGSLALVTCKEPLKSNLGGHIRHYLADFGFTEVCVFFSAFVVASSNVSLANSYGPGPQPPRARQLGCGLSGD